MCIQEQMIDEGVIWRLDGRLAGDAGALLERAVNRAALHGRRRIVMDLSGVSMVDAGGLGALVTVYRACAASSIALSLARVPTRVRHLLAITQLTRVLTIVDSFEPALCNACSSDCASVSLPAARRRESAERTGPDVNHVQPIPVEETGDLFFVRLAGTGHVNAAD